MYKKVIFILLLVVIGTVSNAQNVKVIKLSGLQKILNVKNDTTYVINFWATWCGSCVEELPNFQKLKESYQNKKVQLILVSLDELKNLNGKVKSFVKKKNLKGNLFLLDEPDGNTYINAVDQSWSGSIPATIVMNPNKKTRFFEEKELRFDQLKELVEKASAY